MLKVAVSGTAEELEQFLTQPSVSDWGNPMHFRIGALEDADTHLKLTNELWSNVAESLGRRLNKIAQGNHRDNSLMFKVATERYAEWKALGFPNADENVVPFLESINASEYFKTMWSCVGHVEEDTSESNPVNGYLVVTAPSASHLAMLEELAFRKFCEPTEALSGLTIELHRLLWTNGPDWNNVIAYPCFCVRWWGYDAETLASSYAAAQELMLSLINEVTTDLSAVKDDFSKQISKLTT